MFSDVLCDFLNDDFEVQDYATKVIQNAAISQQLAQLFDGISMLDKELQSQVSRFFIFFCIASCMIQNRKWLFCYIGFRIIYL